MMISCNIDEILKHYPSVHFNWYSLALAVFWESLMYLKTTSTMNWGWVFVSFLIVSNQTYEIWFNLARQVKGGRQINILRPNIFTFYLIVNGLKNALFMHFSCLSKWGAGLLQMIIQRAAAVRGGIGDSSSFIKIDFFLCTIFRTYVIIL